MRKIEITPMSETVANMRERYSQEDIGIVLERCLHLKHLLLTCESVEDVKKRGLKTESGLCLMLHNYRDDREVKSIRAYSLIILTQYSWKDRSGDVYSPVKRGFNHSVFDNWNGENLQQRKNLLEHTIECLREASL